MYDRIVDLTITAILDNGLERIRLFVERFPGLRYLHLQVLNRRMNAESLRTDLNGILRQAHRLIHLKLHFEKDIHSKIGWQTEFNGRVKMHLAETAFDGVLIHVWF